jgi:hypothetical protein
LKVIEKRLILRLDRGGIELMEMQVEGEKKIEAKDFIFRYKINQGDRIN